MPGKFNTPTAPRPTSTVGATAPVRSTSTQADTATYEGGAGWTRDAKSELFLLGVTNLVSEDTFYEKAGDRDTRFRELVRKVTLEDASWIARFIPFLRNTMNLRSASVVMAAEAVKVLNESGAKVPEVTVRSMVDSALVRPDEPGEFVAYWLGHYGRKLPAGVKRGLADAVKRLYSERSALKYDSDASPVRFGDVIELVHPASRDDKQGHLYEVLINRRHKRADTDLGPLTMFRARQILEGLPSETVRAILVDRHRTVAGFDPYTSGAELLTAAGATWEYLSSKYGKLDAAFWEAMIPEMGYMALLRNLRNFDEAGIEQVARDYVVAKLRDPQEVAQSRQLPLRFYSAWSFAKGMAWGPALEEALNLSLANVPSLPGKTLVLVDMSGSMEAPLSGRSKLNRDKAAAVFGTALALRAERANLVAFGTSAEEIHTHAGDSVLRTVDRFRPMGGTNTFQALQAHYAGHDRIVILTDEQAFPSSGYRYSEAVGGLPNVPIYTFNLAGYTAGHLPSGTDNRFTFGGLTDAGFTAIALLERGSAADWPF